MTAESPGLRLEKVSHGGRSTIEAEGEIDLSNADRLRAAIFDEVDAGSSRVFVDLRAVTFMDSTGLRVLIEGHERLNGVSGELVVVVNSGPVDRLLGITGLNEVLSVVDELPADV